MLMEDYRIFRKNNMTDLSLKKRKLGETINPNLANLKVWTFSSAPAKRNLFLKKNKHTEKMMNLQPLRSHSSYGGVEDRNTRTTTFPVASDGTVDHKYAPNHLLDIYTDPALGRNQLVNRDHKPNWFS